MGFHLLSHIALAGDFPASSASRIIPSSSYREKMITELKSKKMLRTYYRDGLRSYRLTAAGRKMLMREMPGRFCKVLDTPQRLKSDPARRLRSFQLAQTALAMGEAGIRIFPDEKAPLFEEAARPLAEPLQLPAYYSSLEVKALGIEATKIKNGRFAGMLLTQKNVWIVYHAGEGALRWYRRSEIKTRALLTHLLCRVKLPGRYQAGEVQAILLGADMDACARQLAAEDCRDARIFRFDQTYEHFHFLPESREGTWLLRLLMEEEVVDRLKCTLSQGLLPKGSTASMENDGFTQDGTPVLFSFDGDGQRLTNFVRALRIHGRKGRAFCFDFQLAAFAGYARDTVSFQAISAEKFRKQFY